MGMNIYRNAKGEQVPGVTTVLGSSLGWKTPGLVHWAWKLGIEGKDYKAERNRAADVGTWCHRYAEALTTKSGPLLIPEEHREKVEGSMRALRAWQAESRLDIVAAEVPLVSERYDFGGCLDAVGVFEGSAHLIDYKSSKDLYPDHVVQVAAYSTLWCENNPDVPATAWHILRWAPDGAFHHHSLSAPQIESGWRVFVAALAIYNERRAVMGRVA